MSIFASLASTPLPTVRAILALVVHEGRESEPELLDYALTSHEIAHTPTGIELGPGRLLGPLDHQRLLDVLLHTQAGDNEFLPPEVLSHSSAQLAWYVPGRPRRMWFRGAKRSKGLTVPWPTLAFRARQGKLSIAALAHARRPGASDPLFHAPLMNIFDDTGLCPGTATLPHGHSLADRAQFEAAVFETAFSHVNHTRTLRRSHDAEIENVDHVRFWEQLARQRTQRFPVRALVPLKQTLSQWLTLEKA